MHILLSLKSACYRLSPVYESRNTFEEKSYFVSALRDFLQSFFSVFFPGFPYMTENTRNWFPQQELSEASLSPIEELPKNFMFLLQFLIAGFQLLLFPHQSFTGCNCYSCLEEKTVPIIKIDDEVFFIKTMFYRKIEQRVDNCSSFKFEADVQHLSKALQSVFFIG